MSVPWIWTVCGLRLVAAARGSWAQPWCSVFPVSLCTFGSSPQGALRNTVTRPPGRGPAAGACRARAAVSKKSFTAGHSHHRAQSTRSRLTNMIFKAAADAPPVAHEAPARSAGLRAGRGLALGRGGAGRPCRAGTSEAATSAPRATTCRCTSGGSCARMVESARRRPRASPPCKGSTRHRPHSRHPDPSTHRSLRHASPSPRRDRRRRRCLHRHPRRLHPRRHNCTPRPPSTRCSSAVALRAGERPPLRCAEQLRPSTHASRAPVVPVAGGHRAARRRRVGRASTTRVS